LLPFTESKARSAAAPPRSASRFDIRLQRTRPLVEALQPWLRQKLSLISQKTKLAEAIRYALSRWAGLCLFLEDGRVKAYRSGEDRLPETVGFSECD
jgi:hypothetical protein